MLSSIVQFINKLYCYASTFVRDIRASYAIREVCRRL